MLENVSVIAFARNAKSFALSILAFWFSVTQKALQLPFFSFFLVLLPLAVFGWTSKSFLLLVPHLLPRKQMTRTGFIHWTH